jgi:hypothetical protein
MCCTTELSLVVARQRVNEALQVANRDCVVPNRFRHEVANDRIHLSNHVIYALVSGAASDVQPRCN